MDIERATPAQTRDRGFTLIEMLLVVVILGVLSAITVLAIRGTTDRTKQTACQADRKTIEIAADLYFAENDDYPDDQSVLIPRYLKSEIDKFVYVKDGDGPSSTYELDPVSPCS